MIPVRTDGADAGADADAGPGGSPPLACEVRGSGPPFLLVHGLSANRTTWHPVAARLESEFTLILPDLLARGESPVDARARFTLANEVARLRDLLERLGAGECLVAGHSHGAALALALAALGREGGAGGEGGAAEVSGATGPPVRGRDDRAAAAVRGVVLVNPVTPWTRRPRILDLLRAGAARTLVTPILRHFREPVTRFILDRRVLPPERRADEEMVERYAAPYADPARAAALARILADWRPAEIGPLVAAWRHGDPPAHVVAGIHDRRTPAADAHRLAERLGARFSLLDGGHALPEERPDEVAGACRAVAGCAPLMPEDRATGAHDGTAAADARAHTKERDRP